MNVLICARSSAKRPVVKCCGNFEKTTVIL